MPRLLLVVTALFIAWYWWFNFKKQPAERRKGFLWRSVFWALLGTIVVLAVTGRMHWIAVAIAAAIPVVKTLFGLAMRILPFLNLKKPQRAEAEGKPEMVAISEQDAWQILGLEPGASRDDIIKAHKRLIQKLHPDRGGNNYLAARINQAKEVLLKTQK